MSRAFPVDRARPRRSSAFRSSGVSSSREACPGQGPARCPSFAALGDDAASFALVIIVSNRPGLAALVKHQTTVTDLA